MAAGGDNVKRATVAVLAACVPGLAALALDASAAAHGAEVQSANHSPWGGGLDPVPMPLVEPREPGPVPMPLVQPADPGPVPMPRVQPFSRQPPPVAGADELTLSPLLPDLQ